MPEGSHLMALTSFCKRAKGLKKRERNEGLGVVNTSFKQEAGVLCLLCKKPGRTIKINGGRKKKKPGSSKHKCLAGGRNALSSMQKARE